MKDLEELLLLKDISVIVIYLVAGGLRIALHLLTKSASATI